MASDQPLDVDTVNAAIAELFPGAASECIELGPDYAIAANDVAATSIRPGGYVSGPTQFSLIDLTLWYLSFVALGRIEPMAVTTELSIRYLRPAIGDRIVCRAQLETVNRRSIVGTAHVWIDGEPGRPTATAQGTYAIPLPR